MGLEMQFSLKSPSKLHGGQRFNQRDDYDPYFVPGGHYLYQGSKLLEPVCCKKRQKIVPGQLLVMEIRALCRF